MRTAIIGAAMALALIQPASAQPLDCKNPSDQASMNACAGMDYKAADKALNETYRTLMGKVSKDGKARLQKAQRAWIAYRDAQCDFDTAGTATGSINPMVRSECLGNMTKAQAQHLDQQLHCQEGDVSCGGQ